MLFNSLPFLFLFLPVVLIGFFVLGRFSKLDAAGFLALQIWARQVNVTIIDAEREER
jgi:hypothetical protein